jgi:hypothetical protein
MDILFHPSGAETASGTTATFGTGNMALCGMFVNVTAASGTLPSLVVTLQHSPDGIVWYNAGNITITITTVATIASAPPALLLLADYSRVAWTISGINPSFTFTVDLVTHPS